VYFRLLDLTSLGLVPSLDETFKAMIRVFYANMDTTWALLKNTIAI